LPTFERIQGAVYCDGLSLAELATRFGTPLYTYDAGAIAARYREVEDAFGDYPHRVHYALKANSTLGIARLLRSLGAAADANSVGEIDVALRAGFTPAEIVFTGVGKTHAELERAISLGLRSINAESEGEIERIDAIASARGVKARVAVRVNPDIDARSHPHISTGLKSNKFGVAIADAREMCLRMRGRSGVQIVGLHSHVGSQITQLEPLRRAAEALVALAAELRDAGVAVEHLDIGGGLGISYEGQRVPTAAEYAASVLPIVRESGLNLILEPGRFLVAQAGMLVTRVVDIKPQAGGKLFVIVDAGMTELMRPMLYGAYHRIEHALAVERPAAICDIVGPICETTDTLGKDRSLPRPEVGDLLVVFDAGAYGAVMASNYNRRPMPAEVLVKDGEATVIRRRQTFDDLIALES
jgi:diaminopimelate decarboxylase